LAGIDVLATRALAPERGVLDTLLPWCLLEQTTLGLDDVASQAGFGRVETLRRTFARTLSLNASEYLKRFRARRR